MAQKTGLAEYLTTRFDAWKKNRDSLEQKWQNNLNAMKQEDSETRKSFKSGEGKGWRSTDYLGIIKSKVLTVFAILVQTLLAKGQIPFKLEPSPYQRDYMEDEESEAVDDRIDKMTGKIREQQKDRNADRETMKKLLSFLIYGMCASKYNVEPVERSGFRQMDLMDNEALMPHMDQDSVRFEEYSKKDNVPGHVYTSLWNMYWDMESGLNFQKCEGYAERQMISPADLKKKKGKPFYIDTAIDRVIAEKRKGETVSDPQSLPPGQREIAERKLTIRNLEFWIQAPKRLVDEFLAEIGKGNDPGEFSINDVDQAEMEAEEVEILVEMADDEIVRLALNNSGKRPHRDCYWEIMLDEAAGAGIADNGDGIQYLFNGILRAAMDNFKLASNVGMGVKSRYLKDPSQLDKALEPGFRLEVADGCDDVRKALQPIVIPDISGSSVPWLNLLWSWKDTVFNVPDILQGNVGPQQKGDTAYEWSQRLDFGSKYIGLGIRNFDEMIVEEEVKDLYYANMRNPDFQDGKGDYIVHATGFAAFQDKLVKTQQLKELLGLLLASEALGMYAKIRPHLEQIYRNLDVDPDEFLRTEEEIQQMQAQQQEAQAQMMQAAQAEKAQEGQAKLDQEALKGDIESKQKEEDFQREIIMEGIDSLKDEEKPAKKAAKK